MMISKIKLIIINILLIFIISLVADQICYQKLRLDILERSYIPIISFDAYKPIVGLKQRYKKYLTNKKEINFRNDLININKPDKSILVLGCSFANGTILPDDKNFSGKLHNITGRSVYNRAMPGWGISEAIILLKNGLSTEIKDPEYIIYVYMDDHLLRLYTTCNPLFSDNTEFFKYDKNKNLIKKEGLSLQYLHSYILRCLYRKLYYSGKIASYEEKNEFLLKHIILLNNLIKEFFPQSKFIILSYSNENNSTLKNIKNEINENNIKLIFLSDLTNINFDSYEYQNSKYDPHPNEKAWETITPLFVKKLSL